MGNGAIEDEYRIFLKKLENLKEQIWKGRSTSDIVKTANTVLVLCTDEPSKEFFTKEGTRIPDEKAKTSMVKVFENELNKVISGKYSDLDQEKLALYTSMSFLIGIFNIPDFFEN